MAQDCMSTEADSHCTDASGGVTTLVSVWGSRRCCFPCTVAINAVSEPKSERQTLSYSSSLIVLLKTLSESLESRGGVLRYLQRVKLQHLSKTYVEDKAIVHPCQDFETKDWNANLPDRASLCPPLHVWICCDVLVSRDANGVVCVCEAHVNEVLTETSSSCSYEGLPCSVIAAAKACFARFTNHLR